MRIESGPHSPIYIQNVQGRAISGLIGSMATFCMMSHGARIETRHFEGAMPMVDDDVS
jgi:hypothetical protein